MGKSVKKNVKKNIKTNGLLSNKSICLMVVISLIFNSIIYIKELIHIASVNPSLSEVSWLFWLVAVFIILILFNLLLWISLILSIINVKKTKLLFLVFILIFNVLNLILVLDSYFTYHDIFWLLNIMQSVLLYGVIIIRLFKYKNDK